VEEETLAENEEYLIDRKTLQEHLRFFKKQYDMVPLSLLWDLLHSGETLNEKWLSIVLDDAYQNQVFLGASVLADYQVPWSLAVPAGLIGSSRGVWSNELAVLVERCWSKESLPLPGKANRSVSTRTLGERRIAARWVRNILFDQGSSLERTEYLNELIHDVGEDSFLATLAKDKRYRMASWEEVRQLSTAGIELLSHGYYHLPHNRTLAEDDLRREVYDSKSLIEKHCGVSVRGFVFPHGTYKPDKLWALRAAGYEFALTSLPKRITNIAHPFLLPRVTGDYSLSAVRNMIATL
jgi:peptidoglycan/xylan/chitin deacetylase (PgdA/CDA1 family)